MYRNNQISFSQKNINPKIRSIFVSNNYTNNYYNGKSPINYNKKKINNLEINQINNSWKKNLRKLKNTPNKFKNNSSVYNKDSNEINKDEKNIISSFKLLPTDNNINQKKGFNYYLDNNKNSSNNVKEIKVIELKNINNYNSKVLPTNNDNNEQNIDGYFYSNFPNYSKNNVYSNDITNNSQAYNNCSMSQRSKKTKNLFLHKSCKNIFIEQNNNISKLYENKNKNKEKNKMYKIEQIQLNKNYLTLFNGLEKLKSTVDQYQKSNLELKQQIELLNNKISRLSNKNNNTQNNKEEKEINEKCYVRKRVNSYKGINNSQERIKFNNSEINNIQIYKSVSPKALELNHKIKYNFFLDEEKKENKIKNNMKIYYNCFNDVNYIENQKNNQNILNGKDNLKSRNLSQDLIFISNNNSNILEDNTSNLNNIISETFNNNYGNIVNISEINYHKKTNTMNNNNSKSNIFNNITPKDDIIEKRILLKQKIKDELRNNFRGLNFSCCPDINEFNRKSYNDISNISDANQSNLQKKKIFINISGISSSKKKNNEQQSILNISNLNNYIYQRKTKTHSYNRKKRDIKANNDYDCETLNQKKIIKMPKNIINITPVKKNKTENSKTSRHNMIKKIKKINFKSNNNRNAILQRLLKKSPKNKQSNDIKIENNNLFLYGIDNKNNLFEFDITKKIFNKYKIYEIKDLSKNFYGDYIYNSSILLNTLDGIYILTGINSNILYFYSSKTKSISKICTFFYSHYKGSLLLDKENDRIFVFSGKNSKKCEYFSFTRNKVIEIPELNIDRTNASFFIKNHIIYCFFGYSSNNNQYINNIEFIDTKVMKHWENRYINFNFNFVFNVERCANVAYKEEANEVYLFIECKKNRDNKIKRMLWLCLLDREEINIINNMVIEKYAEDECAWTKINNEDNGNEYYFDKCFNFVELPSKVKSNYFDNNYDKISVILDNKSNAYFFYKNQMKMEIYKKN